MVSRNLSSSLSSNPSLSVVRNHSFGYHPGSSSHLPSSLSSQSAYMSPLPPSLADASPLPCPLVPSPSPDFLCLSLLGGEEDEEEEEEEEIEKKKKKKKERRRGKEKVTEINPLSMSVGMVGGKRGEGEGKGEGEEIVPLYATTKKRALRVYFCFFLFFCLFFCLFL